MHTGVDWKTAPKNAQWWAVDANGRAHWFLWPDIAPFTIFGLRTMPPRRSLVMRATGVRASLPGPNKASSTSQDRASVELKQSPLSTYSFRE